MVFTIKQCRSMFQNCRSMVEVPIWDMIRLVGKIAIALFYTIITLKNQMQDRSLEAKKEYLNKMSQHFKEISDRQDNNETQRVMAKTLSKNADIPNSIIKQTIIFDMFIARQITLTSCIVLVTYQNIV